MADSADIARFFDAEHRPPRGGWLVVIDGRRFPENGVGTSESATFQAVKRWRQNNGSYVNDVEISRELWAYWRSREPRRATTTAGGHSGDVTRTWKNREGPKKWAALHSRAAATILAGRLVEKDERDFLYRFKASITCDECRTHWIQLSMRNPPDLSSPMAYFRWTVDRHNNVNARLGKPEFTLAQAKALYLPQ